MNMKQTCDQFFKKSYRSLFNTASLALIIALSLNLNACTSTAQSGTQDNAVLDDPNVDPALKHEEASFFSKSGAVACGTGASIGALACLLIANDNSRASCIAAAATVGCALGMGSNYLMDKVRDNYATAEEQLDATYEQVQKDLATTRNLRENAQQVLAEDQAEVKRLNKEYKKGQVSKEVLEKKNAELDANIKYLSKQRDEALNRLQQAQDTRNMILKDAGGNDSLAAQEQRKLHDLDAQIAALKEEIRGVNDSISDYSLQREALKV